MTQGMLRSSEASALHAAIDEDYGRVADALADYSAGELRRLAKTLADLADWCRDQSEER